MRVYIIRNKQIDKCICIEIYWGQQVRSLFRERSLDVWAVGADTAYHFHVPLLYDAILPARCRTKVAGMGKRLHIILHKQASPEWRFLKG